MPYVVLDPTDEPVKSTFSLAPRPERLAGLTLGIIDNGKKNADTILKGILGRLQIGERIGDSVTVRKPSLSHGIPEELARSLAEQCQVVIAGVGD